MAVARHCPVPACEHVHGPRDRFCAIHGAELVVESAPLVDPGEVIVGKYKIIRRIGMGGMGEVHLAVQTQPQQNVAIKILHPSLMADHAKRFLEEAERAAQVKHPHGVTIYETGQTDKGLLFFVMEFIPGADLSELIKQEGPKSPVYSPDLWTVRSLAMVRQICDVLEYAHNLTPPLIHRDIKPSNIRVWNAPGARDFVKLLDFGIAKQIGVAGLTTSGQVPGTPGYISPEQIEGKQLDARADLYSLGIVLFEMLTGELPFQGRSDYDTALMRLRISPPPARSKNARLDPLVDRIVGRLLEKNPRDRPTSAADLRVAIETIERRRDDLSTSRSKEGRAQTAKEPSTLIPHPPKEAAQATKKPRTFAWIAPLGWALIGLFAGFLLFRVFGSRSTPDDIADNRAPTPNRAAQGTVAETVLVSPIVNADSILSLSRGLYEERYRRDSLRLQKRYANDSATLALQLRDVAASGGQPSMRPTSISPALSEQPAKSPDTSAAAGQGTTENPHLAPFVASQTIQPGETTAVLLQLRPGGTTNSPCPESEDHHGISYDRAVSLHFSSRVASADVLLIPDGERADSLKVWIVRTATPERGSRLLPPLPDTHPIALVFRYDPSTSRIFMSYGGMPELVVNVFHRGNPVTIAICARSIPIVFARASP